MFLTIQTKTKEKMLRMNQITSTGSEILKRDDFILCIKPHRVYQHFQYSQCNIIQTSKFAEEKELRIFLGVYWSFIPAISAIYLGILVKENRWDRCATTHKVVYKTPP